jgi:hypothetical protein
MLRKEVKLESEPQISLELSCLIINLKKNGYSYDSAVKLFSELAANCFKKEKDVFLPIYILGNKKLTPLEAIVKYLRENLDFKFNKIAKLLDRKAIPISNCYRNAIKKIKPLFVLKKAEYYIPTSIFRNEMSIFESLVGYMKDSLELSYHKIALLLNRDDRTIWTVYQRAKKKKEGLNER